MSTVASGFARSMMENRSFEETDYGTYYWLLLMVALTHPRLLAFSTELKLGSKRSPLPILRERLSQFA